MEHVHRNSHPTATDEAAVSLYTPSPIRCPSQYRAEASGLGVAPLGLLDTALLYRAAALNECVQIHLI